MIDHYRCFYLIIKYKTFWKRYMNLIPLVKVVYQFQLVFSFKNGFLFGRNDEMLLKIYLSHINWYHGSTHSHLCYVIKNIKKQMPYKKAFILSHSKHLYSGKMVVGEFFFSTFSWIAQFFHILSLLFLLQYRRLSTNYFFFLDSYLFFVLLDC